MESFFHETCFSNADNRVLDVLRTSSTDRSGAEMEPLVPLSVCATKKSPWDCMSQELFLYRADNRS